ncbi:hypothetical protein JX265_002299 [Neoarthrinium moseri]|uniref:Uncharacterized protein n=1 Tax=Neoarthrinium moseri TaxID=1658444 RepID=A0A9P9WTZ7_9PEZI|nr:hypothetical protein JX265_002299 [Neoarthrinium moseri]
MKTPPLHRTETFTPYEQPEHGFLTKQSRLSLVFIVWVTGVSAECRFNGTLDQIVTDCTFPNGADCFAGDFYADCSSKFYRPSYFPPQYTEIYSSEGLYAFPGTVCVDGWTAVCTVTVSIETANSTQTWCCPKSYDCWASVGEAILSTDGNVRVCTSAIAWKEVIWVNSETNLSPWSPGPLDALATSLHTTLPSLTALHPVFLLSGETIPPATITMAHLAGAMVGGVARFLLLVAVAVSPGESHAMSGERGLVLDLTGKLSHMRARCPSCQNDRKDGMNFMLTPDRIP